MVQKLWHNYKKMAKMKKKKINKRGVFFTKFKKPGNGNICVLGHNFWTKYDSDLYSTSKWQLESQFWRKIDWKVRKTAIYQSQILVISLYKLIVCDLSWSIKTLLIWLHLWNLLSLRNDSDIIWNEVHWSNINYVRGKTSLC